MIILSLILAAPTSLAASKLMDQQRNQVDPQTLADNFRAKIIDTQESGTATTLNITELTNFAWDKLYLFGPYTSHTQINERLGYTWTRNSLRLLDDSLSLLVFVRDGKVVQFLDLTTGIQGDSTAFYTPERSVIQFSQMRSDKNQPYMQLLERSE
ncbi:hypothetical protein A8709_06505 [Paenibacillus pectinilyticus]|uniref:Lipoprotein SmpA/OmlA domain-containing protein n=2 Tax=Paenibacillus pectinilyticus TaxID=512399 RepID=A0A1C0ZTD4_9BACL|nr:hypothetical protein A8709_06505 [Paenibacillus pectinilyticus]